MKLGIFLTTLGVSVFLCGTTRAALGPTLPEHEVLPQVCVISYESSSSDSDRFTEVCTGTLIRDRYLLTAGHCGEAPLENMSVYCPSSSTENRIKQIHPASGFDNDAMREEVPLRRHDVALFELENPLPSVKPLPNWRAFSFYEYEECAFFGYSNLLGKPKNSSLPSPDRIHVPISSLKFVDGLIELDGYSAPGALVEPGDSGGALACRKVNSDWRVLGVVSGRDYDYKSFFAPLFANPELEQILFQEPADRTGLYEVGQHLSRIRSLYQMDLEQCEDRLKKAHDKIGEVYETPPPLPDSNLDLDRRLLSCQEQEVEFIRSHPNLIYRIKPFSQLEFVNPVWPELLPEGEKQRLENWKAPFSSVDHRYNRFFIERIEGNLAFGRLELMAYSEGFTCEASFLCREGTYQTVVTPLENLLLEVFLPR